MSAWAGSCVGAPGGCGCVRQNERARAGVARRSRVARVGRARVDDRALPRVPHRRFDTNRLAADENIHQLDGEPPVHFGERHERHLLCMVRRIDAAQRKIAAAVAKAEREGAMLDLRSAGEASK